MTQTNRGQRGLHLASETSPRCKVSAVLVTGDLNPPYSLFMKLFAILVHASLHPTEDVSVDARRRLMSSCSFVLPATALTSLRVVSSLQPRDNSPFHADPKLLRNLSSFCAYSTYLSFSTATCHFCWFCASHIQPTAPCLVSRSRNLVYVGILVLKQDLTSTKINKNYVKFQKEQQ